MLPIFLILAAIAGAAAVTLLMLNFKRIVQWFVGRRALKESDKENIAFSVQEKLKNGEYKTVQGIFNTASEEVLDAEVYESKEIDKDLENIHSSDKLVIYN